MLTFVLNRPEVGAATLSVAAGTIPPSSLITLAGPDNAVLEEASNAFKAVEAAFEAALASKKVLANKLLAFQPCPFKVTGAFTLKKSADSQQVASEINDALQAAYAISAMKFDQPVRSTDIVTLIVEQVPAVAAAEVKRLWVPTREEPTRQAEASAAPPQPPAPYSHEVLWPNPATLDTGAQILCLSTDADAVSFDYEAELSSTDAGEKAR